MSRVRMHFCTLVARGYGAGTRPVRYGTNGTMPATVNSSVGASEPSEAPRRRGVVGDERGARHDRVTTVAEEVQPAALDISGVHAFVPMDDRRAGRPVRK